MRGGFFIVTVVAGLSTAGFAPQALAQSSADKQAGHAEMRELVDAMRKTAQATRESADYNAVVPDILTQVLAKLDKIENKLDKIENVLKASDRKRASR